MVSLKRRLPRTMLERIWEYLSRNVKIAWKSVFFNFKQYSCFFAAIFIIQLLFGMMAISANNNNSVEYQQIKQEQKLTLRDENGDPELDDEGQIQKVDYHYEIHNLNQSQYSYLAKYKSENGAFDEQKQLYVILDTVERMNEKTGTPMYDVFMRFGKEKNLEDSAKVNQYYKEFEKNYLEKLETLSDGTEKFQTKTTMLLDYDTRVAANNTTFLFIFAILLVLSVFLLTSIYNIRINQYKFTYGVYMTFGADFKMLFGTAFWELFVIMLVTYIPAALASTGIVYFIYAPSGFKFAFSAITLLQLFGFSFLVVLASVFMPMRFMSTRQPMSLIKTEDNANLVTSPRKSFNLLGKKFPLQYELYSIWRFRKYNIQLLTTAVIFCALFICGLYLSNIYTTDLEYPRAQFEMELTDTNTKPTEVLKYNLTLSKEIQEINEDFLRKYPEFAEKEGFKAIATVEPTGNATPVDDDADVNRGPVTEARYIKSFMLVEEKDAKITATNLFVYPSGNDVATAYQGTGSSYKVTNEVIYKAIDPDNPEDVFNFLSQYTIEGELSDILKSNKTTNYCIVGDAQSNITTFKFDVGDKIALASYKSEITAVDSNLSGKNLLRRQIKNYMYDYTTLEVCAVIKDIPSGSVPVYMLNDAYQTVTKRDPAVTKLNIYVDPTLNIEQVRYIEAALRDIAPARGQSNIGEVTVTNLEQNAENVIRDNKHYSELFVVISILILCISPIIWFFSQILFYFKREKEFDIIQSMGATEANVRTIYLLGGLSMAVMSFVFSIILSYVASYAMFYVVNVVLPNFTFEYVRYVFYMPWYALVISIVMSVACGFFSVYIPYKSYFKHRYAINNVVRDEE